MLLSLAGRAGGDSPAPLTRNVVVRYADGRTEHGYTYDLDPRLPCFHLFPPAVICSRAVEVWLRDLKAVEFVRSDAGSREPRGGDRDAAGEARKVRVAFRDGEVLTGFATACDRRRVGFFVVPDAAIGRTERVFAVWSAIQTVDFD